MAKTPNIYNLAKPYKPDMNHILRGSIDIGGGIQNDPNSKLAGNMQTNYQRNYNMI